MHQTVSRYVTPGAAKNLSDLYSKISQAYSRRSSDDNLQVLLDGVKKTLAETRRATGIEFLCFRQTKSKSTPGGTGGSSGGSSGAPKTRERERERTRDKERDRNVQPAGT